MVNLGFQLSEKKKKKGKRTTADALRSLIASELIAMAEENRARVSLVLWESVVLSLKFHSNCILG